MKVRYISTFKVHPNLETVVEIKPYKHKDMTVWPY